jgi:hypothetical protein
MVTCRCVDPDLYKCLSERFQAGLSLARVMAGCNCRCHQTKSGASAITREEWQKNRERMARPERPLLPAQNKVRDPRIRALLEGGE